MMKAGATKVGLPKPGLQERAKQASLAPSSSSATSTAMKTSRSSNMLASDQRLSRLKRASSDDALTKPALGAAASGSRMKKTVTTGAISDLAEARPRNLSGAQAAKKSGIPAPRETSSTITRDRISLRDQLRSSTSKRMVSSASTSSLSTLAKQTRSTAKSRVDIEVQEKGLLECQVKELLAEAKAKDLEISNLRMELQRCKGKASTASSSPSPNSVSRQEPAAEQEEGQVAEALVLVGELREKNGKFQRELASLREENQGLKEKLLCLEDSPLASTNTNSPSKLLLNGLPSVSNSSAPQQDSLHSTASPLKTSVSSSSDVTKDSPSPDSSEFEKIPSRSESISSGVSGEAVAEGAVTSAGGQNVSVQSLTEQIHKMEESHHSTAEELQATLQELADQQQVVQELTAENERLAEEKRLLQTSLQQQRERLEMLAQKNEALAGRLQEQAQAQAKREEELGSQGPRLAELEQRYAELVESSRFEREKLVDIQQQLTGSLRALEEEHQEAQGQVRCLREEMERLQAQLDRELEAGGQAAQSAEEQRATADCLRLENSRLKAQVDIERQKVGELKAMQSASDSTELQSLLKTAHAERDRLEVELTELRQELLQAQAETEHVQAMMSKVEAKCQQVQERAERREQELNNRVSSLEEAGIQTENQVKELKETIFELEDQVEQQRAVNLHTNQAVLDMENLVKKLEEQKTEAERHLKVFNRQMKDEKEEWRRFQADLQTAVVVANDIKVEAQQELRTLRRQLQEEQDRSAKLSADLEALQGVRSQGEEVKVSDSDNSRHWCGISMIPTTPADASGDADSEPGATVKSLIKSFDTVGQNGPGHTVQMHSSPRSPLSGIPVRTAPAAAVSPIQRQSYIKPLSKTLEKRINHGEFSHHHDKLSGCGEDMKPASLMRKSPSLESVIKTPSSLGNRTASFSYNRANSKLSVERKDPLAALAREYGGSKRNALLKWCQKKTEGYPNIDVTNFSSSWSDGLAFCALLHTYLPAHIPYQELISQDKVRNLTLAFQAAESIGIKPSLDIEELMKTDRPDWQSVMQYVSQIYKYFET
ncbi:cytospin-B isoform X1 [Thunnus maccoyii]|uniref:cytospin-B isoform X1 n=1 Tax=Thunnus maccoyii TaxID=8240 RepID=UPI001C4BF92A|nr:cytospin-B isoform X1 [Thunnus maccoyii]XP_042286634.1 cytospin-B isoform X1 [Thunnus maccoyii]XP_042286635.1 cytospin-B isoform X1 [Thunnus maccoyii]XP_042286636.1 cytospin-B isoform X1 [Thunnus maccoyii]